MAFPYKHVLLIGATSGIGAAMADQLIQSGVKVTAIGRRKDRLDAFVAKHTSKLASSFVIDISNIFNIPKFASNVMEAHPDIDCIFLNSGIQQDYDFSKPESVDLEQFHLEITTNFGSYVAMTHAFLPYLMKSSAPSGIIFTGTHISLVPAVTKPAYSASKAALDAFMMCLREQLRSSSVKVTHISPPLVQTELHDAEMGPEIGRKMGMPVALFTEEAYNGIASGLDNIFIGTIGGSSREQIDHIAKKRTEAFDRLCKLLANH